MHVFGCWAIINLIICWKNANCEDIINFFNMVMASDRGRDMNGRAVKLTADGRIPVGGDSTNGRKADWDAG